MQCVAWGERFRQRLEGRNPADPRHVIGLVDAILASAREAAASDVHLVPQESGLAMSFRLDGVLQPVVELPKETSSNVIARLKVLAELLTYRTDVPQEGRVRSDDRSIEMRVSTFPTLFGEKAVVRLFAGSGEFRFLGELGLPVDIEPALQQLLERRNGLLLITGPAGSGKTTTAYACLREIVRSSGATRSIASLEDPIEAVVPGVAQSQINSVAGFDYATGLKSLMRQDPEVIFVGEIRDQNTAMTAFQASLTGQLVLTTFHSSSASGAVSRLSDMGIEPYLLRSGVVGIVGQRLLRKLCSCATQNIGADDAHPAEPGTRRVAVETGLCTTDESHIVQRPGNHRGKLGGAGDITSQTQCATGLSLGLKVARAFQPVGCEYCGGTGYRGRMIISELLQPDLSGLGRAILSRGDAAEIEALAVQAGMTSLWQRALQAVESGQTSPAEVRRVLGWEQGVAQAARLCV